MLIQGNSPEMMSEFTNKCSEKCKKVIQRFLIDFSKIFLLGMLAVTLSKRLKRRISVGQVNGLCYSNASF